MFFLGGNSTSSGVAMAQTNASSQNMNMRRDQEIIVELFNHAFPDTEAYIEDGRIRYRDRPKDYSNEIQELKQEIQELKSVLKEQNKQKEKEQLVQEIKNRFGMNNDGNYLAITPHQIAELLLERDNK